MVALAVHRTGFNFQKITFFPRELLIEFLQEKFNYTISKK